MSTVTGPISTLPNTSHDLPEGTKCDEHPTRPAVARIQGETDSFGAEMNDLCEECLASHQAYEASPEAQTGTCDWCGGFVTDLHKARDYDEGSRGPVYEVCGTCRTKQLEDAQRELEESGYYDYADCDDGDDE